MPLYEFPIAFDMSLELLALPLGSVDEPAPATVTWLEPGMAGPEFASPPLPPFSASRIKHVERIL